MARRVDEVQDVLLAVERRVVEAHRVRLDGDAALALEVHAVEHLRLHLAGLQGAREFEEAIGQRRLAVVDVRDDGEIANVARIHEKPFIIPWRVGSASLKGLTAFVIRPSACGLSGLSAWSGIDVTA